MSKILEVFWGLLGLAVLVAQTVDFPAIAVTPAATLYAMPANSAKP